MPLKRLLNIALIVLSVLTVILTFLAVKNILDDNKSFTLNEPSLHNVLYPYKTGEDSFSYYNGNTFVSYDNKKGDITPLTTNLALYDVQNAYWYRDGVLFNVSDISETSNLSPLYEPLLAELAATGDESQIDALNPDLIYWNLSFKTGDITPIGPFTENEVQGIRSSDGGFVFNNLHNFSKISPEGNLIRSYAPIFGSEEMRLLYANDNFIYYLEETAGIIDINRYDILSNKTETSVEDLYDGAEVSIDQPVYMLDDKSVFYLRNSGQVGGVGVYDLTKHTIASNQSQTLAENVQGFMKKSGTSHLTYIHLGREVVEVSVVSSDGSVRPYRLNDVSRLINDGFTLSNTLVSFEANGKVYDLVRGERTKINPSTLALEKDFKSSDASLVRNILTTNDTSYTLTVVSGSVSEQRQKLFTYIEEKGFSPYEFTIVTIKGMRATD